jgi:nucleoside-diphosphate-sugar epimerase
LKVLITGGRGFIGKYVVSIFKSNNIDVDVWDKVDGDDIMKISATSEKYDAMIHLAANLEILNVDPIREMELNVKGTVRMLEVCRKCGIPKFVYASSTAVYGEPIKLPSKETDPLVPFWSYGSSKLSSEVYCKQYEELYGIKTVIIRPSIVTGVGEWFGRFVTLSMARIRENKPILVFGDGKQTRDFINVVDLANIIFMATVKDLLTPAIFNGGSGQKISIYEMAHIILNACHNLKIEYPNPCIKWIDPPAGEYGRKLHELNHMQLDMSYTEPVLGYKVSVPINLTIENELRWVMKMSNKDFKKWTRRPRY